MRITYTAKQDFEASGMTFNRGMRVTLIQDTTEYVKVSPCGLEKYMTIEIPTEVFDKVFGNAQVEQ